MKFTRMGITALCLIHTLLHPPAFSQTITASPQHVIRPFGANTVTVLLDRINAAGTGSRHIVVSDAGGRRMQQQMMLSAGTNNVPVQNPDRSPAGNYTLTIPGESVHQSIKFIIAR